MGRPQDLHGPANDRLHPVGACATPVASPHRATDVACGAAARGWAHRGPA
jgi:hypothetical protein